VPPSKLGRVAGTCMGELVNILVGPRHGSKTSKFNEMLQISDDFSGFLEISVDV